MDAMAPEAPEAPGRFLSRSKICKDEDEDNEDDEEDEDNDEDGDGDGDDVGSLK